MPSFQLSDDSRSQAENSSETKVEEKNIDPQTGEIHNSVSHKLVREVHPRPPVANVSGEVDHYQAEESQQEQEVTNENGEIETIIEKFATQLISMPPKGNMSPHKQWSISKEGGSISPKTAMTLPQQEGRLQNDPNAIIIKKNYPREIDPYIQNVHVRYLQPPKCPTPGPIIVKELIPDPRPAPPPLYIRQRQQPPPSPQPIILRERPPPPPPIIKPTVINKRLPSPPAPPRQVIIERDPPLPPKPPAVIIEKWLPYPPMPKRKIIYQRAMPKVAKAQKNIIIQYEGTPKIRQEIHNLGTIQVDPEQYQLQHGSELLSEMELQFAARRAGISSRLPVMLASPSKNSQSLQENCNLQSSCGSYNFEDMTIYSGVETTDQHQSQYPCAESQEDFASPKNTEITQLSDTEVLNSKCITEVENYLEGEQSDVPINRQQLFLPFDESSWPEELRRTSLLNTEPVDNEENSKDFEIV